VRPAGYAAAGDPRGDGVKTHLGPPSRDFEASEFVLVIAIAFGLSIVGSLSAALSYRGGAIEFGDKELAATVIYELVASAFVALILRSRRWRWTDFAVHRPAAPRSSAS
jgi:hypothetical protein